MIIVHVNALFVWILLAIWIAGAIFGIMGVEAIIGLILFYCLVSLSFYQWKAYTILTDIKKICEDPDSEKETKHQWKLAKLKREREDEKWLAEAEAKAKKQSAEAEAKAKAKKEEIRKGMKVWGKGTK